MRCFDDYIRCAFGMRTRRRKRKNSSTTYIVVGACGLLLLFVLPIWITCMMLGAAIMFLILRIGK